jgi:prepilin-type processing-associated H-X9-DG protein
VTDGLANTVIFSEFIKGRDTLTATVRGQDGLHMIYENNIKSDAFVAQANADYQAFQACQKAVNQVDDGKGKRWINQKAGKGGGYSHTMPPNVKACFYGTNDSFADLSLVGASSQHPGGVNCLMLDGSVKFIKSGINYQTWLAIGSMNQGEIVSADAF